MAAPGVSRRRALTGAAVVGLGGSCLAACGDDGSHPVRPAAESPSEAPTRARTRTPDQTPSSARPAAPPADALTPASEVPEGGGRVLAEEKVVVTQPASGQFRGFSAVCTHQGCVVANVADGTINCTCHGSRFSIQDGSVVTGPVSSPLPPVDVAVRGDHVTRA